VKGINCHFNQPWQENKEVHKITMKSKGWKISFSFHGHLYSANRECFRHQHIINIHLEDMTMNMKDIRY